MSHQCPLEEKVARRNELKEGLIAAFILVSDPDFPQLLTRGKDGIPEENRVRVGLELHAAYEKELAANLRSWSYAEVMEIITEAFEEVQKRTEAARPPAAIDLERIASFLDRVWTEFRDALAVQKGFSQAIGENQPIGEQPSLFSEE